ncbi:MAG TPA: biotin--[acetyl-CoA-carboxylase] ligase [Chitinophagaceae bacterium]|nr:biotin--[acetyl-CoA-carboxylase] ligase [Chitinophagaceae bacterium]
MPIGEPLVILTSVDSTNKYAMQQVHAHMAKHGAAYFAMEQTKGKGQRGKTWETAPGENIILSIVTSPQCVFPADPFIFNAAVALACYEFYKKWGGDETSIKWPNDIYWRDRKAGGILIENIVNGSSWNWSIVGIGINVNQVSFDPAIPNPVSLRQIRGELLDPLTLAKELLALLEQYWSIWKHDPAKLLEAYNSVLFRKGEKTRFKTGNRIFEAEVKGVNAAGQLVVYTAVEEHFNFGDLVWI